MAQVSRVRLRGAASTRKDLAADSVDKGPMGFVKFTNPVTAKRASEEVV